MINVEPTRPTGWLVPQIEAASQRRSSLPPTNHRRSRDEQTLPWPRRTHLSWSGRVDKFEKVHSLAMDRGEDTLPASTRHPRTPDDRPPVTRTDVARDRTTARTSRPTRHDPSNGMSLADGLALIGWLTRAETEAAESGRSVGHGGGARRRVRRQDSAPHTWPGRPCNSADFAVGLGSGKAVNVSVVGSERTSASAPKSLGHAASVRRPTRRWRRALTG